LPIVFSRLFLYDYYGSDLSKKSAMNSGLPALARGP
jgi:hypothetical protein